MKKRALIAIDGPSGAGKTTLSRLLAERLGFVHIDTGAMYRAFAVFAISQRINLNDEKALVDLLDHFSIEFKNNRIHVNGIDYSERIRSMEAGEGASKVGVSPAVREKLVRIQRELAKNGGVVMEGRDIGSYVLPHADVKFFITASLQERASRRFKEFRKGGKKISFQKVMEDIKTRDERDSKRKHAPLRISKDAIIVDTTNQKIQESLAELLKILKERGIME